MRPPFPRTRALVEGRRHRRRRRWLSLRRSIDVGDEREGRGGGGEKRGFARAASGAIGGHSTVGRALAPQFKLMTFLQDDPRAELREYHHWLRKAVARLSSHFSVFISEESSTNLFA